MNTKTTSRTFLMRKFHALLKELNIMDQRDSILEGYGYEHARDLPDDLLDDAVRRLVELRDGKAALTRMLRSDILTVLQKLGVYMDNNSWSRVNEYLLQPRIAGKMLYQMSDVELVALRIKLNSILSKQEKMVNQERNLATKN
jgi:hypothetical protein